MKTIANILIESASFIALVALMMFITFGAAIWRMLGSIGEHETG